MNCYQYLASFEVFGSLVADILDEKHGYKRFMKIMRDKYILQAYWDEADWTFIKCMLEALEGEYNNQYHGGTRKLYDITCNWIIDSPECSYELNELMNYDKFAKSLHNKQELFENLGYSIEFGRLSKENTSSVTIKPHNILE